MLPQKPESPGPRATPARRRHNRVPSTRSPANKTYASESDVPSELQFPIEMANGNGSGFATPQKSASNSPAPQPQQQSTNARPKGRNGNKPRPKSGFAPSSPGPAKQNRRTPPNTLPANPPAAPTAFAGATFHASPAPASLPLPSFLAKALDSPQVKDSGKVNQHPSPPLSDTDLPTPRRTSALAREVEREESPLDLFFRADREEKERARRASTANALPIPAGPYSPPNNHIQYPQQPSTVPNRPTATLSRRDLLQRNSSAGRISATELDGTPGQPMGPAFSTPYAERMRAARGGSKSIERPPSGLQQAPNLPLGHRFNPPPAPQPSVDGAEALKRLLGVGSSSSTIASPPAAENVIPIGVPHPQQSGGPAEAAQQYSQRQPSIPIPLGDSQGPRPESPRSQDIARLEDNLRRMLKIDAAGSSLTL